jgi:two-component system response regulator HydG
VGADFRVLILDDERSIRFSLSEILGRKGYRVEAFGDPFEALGALEEFSPHVVVADYALPKMDGLEFMSKVRERAPHVVVIFMTAYGTEELAVEAMKRGAYDYFKKPFKNDAVLVSISKAREKLDLLKENRQLREQAFGSGSKKAFLGESPSVQEVFRMVDRIAGTDVTVLLQGESGTGKELVAGAIHRRSDRSGSPFIKLNCAAIPENLVESELFGHEAGAFTGAGVAKKGKFEAADGGTLFLDEIGDMSAAAQTKVLRALQEGEIEPVGSSTPRHVDVRILAATHQDLLGRVRSGEFREDLYYRLNVVNLRIPPLRERGDDIRLLLEHFNQVYAERFGQEPLAISDQDCRRFLEHPWPGNVRELENVVARGVLAGSLQDLPACLPGEESSEEDKVKIASERAEEKDAVEFGDLPYKEAKRLLLEGFERRYLSKMLERAGWNVAKAARLAGMHRKNFWEKVQKLGLQEFQDEKEGAL